MRPKDIGTAAETAVVRYLRTAGFPGAERRALTGTHDLGDITGCPGLVFEIKGGQAAKTAGDGQVAYWLAETDTERLNAKADVGVLVMARAGYGPARAHHWWALITAETFAWLLDPGNTFPFTNLPVRMHLETVCALLVAAGYGSATYLPAAKVTK